MDKYQIQKKLLEPYKEIIEVNKIIAEFKGFSVDDTGKMFNGIHYYKITSPVPYNELTIDNVRSLTTGFQWNYISSNERRYDNDWNQIIQLLYEVQEAAYKIWNEKLTDDKIKITVDFYLNKVTAIDDETGIYMFRRKSENMLANLYFTLADVILWIKSKQF